jgi:hypothetical protein
MGDLSMSSIDPLGDKFNILHSPTTTARRVSLRDCSGIAFYVAGASGATALSITEATAQTGGTSQALPGLASLRFFTMANGAGTWTLGAGAPTTIANAAAGLYCFVPQGMLSDGFSYLAGSHATGQVIMVQCDLNVGRYPTNLRSVDA